MSTNPIDPAAGLPDTKKAPNPAELPYAPGLAEAKPGPEEHQTVASVNERSNLAENWFLRNEGSRKHDNVHFPMRPDVEAMHLVCGQKFFRELAEAIASASRSIDLVSWGLDTDMVLVRSDGTTDYALTQRYQYEAYCSCAKDACKAIMSPCPHKDKAIDPSGLRFSDLLTCVARRGVKVRILVWEPVFFAKNVIDPCNYWFRCKTQKIPNTQFAFREFKGIYAKSKPSQPQIKVTKTGMWNWVGGKIDQLRGVTPDSLEEYQGGLFRAQEEKLRKIFSASKDGSDNAFYSFLYSHHQKMALIDVDDGPDFHPDKALGFIMGFNFKEEYWDDTSHDEISSLRLSRKREGRIGQSLGPWQDVGVKLRGSILYDMAQNMEQSWRQKNEVLPPNFIGNGVAALTPEEAQKEGWNNASFVAIQKSLGKLTPVPIADWDHNFQHWGMGICALLTGIIELLGAVQGGKFDVLSLVQEEGAWSGKPVSPERLVPSKGPKDGWYQQPAQYLRTFSLKEPPLDQSIAKAVLHTVDLVQSGGLLYYENQYFRDPYLGDELTKLYNTRGNGTEAQQPYTIIVTNRQTDDRGQPVNQEAMVAAKPTKMVYEQLRASAGANNILWCWLHVKNRNKLDPDSPREAHHGEYLFNAILRYQKEIGDDRLKELHDKLRRWRNLMYYCLNSNASAVTSRGTAVLVGTMASASQWMSALGVPINLWLSDALLDTKQFLIARLLEMSGPAYEGAQHIPAIPDASGNGSSGTADANGDVNTNVNPWEIFEQLVDRIPEPPAFLADRVSLRDPSEDIAKWFDKNKPQSTVEERRRAEIARLEDHGSIVDSLLSQASSPREYAYAFSQKSLNSLLLWKHRRLQSKSDEELRAIKGAIYVHSKVIIIDENLTMIGSNNINERSMWHDSENAVMFRSTEREGMPAELRSQLFEIMAGTSLKGFPEQAIFAVFLKNAKENMDKLIAGGLIGHVVEYIPDEVAIGSSVLS